MLRIIDIHFYVMYNSSYPICQSFSRDFFRICLQLPSLSGNVAVYNTSLYLTDMKNHGKAWLDDGERTLTQKSEKEKAYVQHDSLHRMFFLCNSYHVFYALSNNDVVMQYIQIRRRLN